MERDRAAVLLLGSSFASVCQQRAGKGGLTTMGGKEFKISRFYFWADTAGFLDKYSDVDRS